MSILRSLAYTKPAIVNNEIWPEGLEYTDGTGGDK